MKKNFNKIYWTAVYYAIAGILATAVQSWTFDYQVLSQIFSGLQVVALVVMVGLAVARFLPIGLKVKRQTGNKFAYVTCFVVFGFGVAATTGMNVFYGFQQVQVNADKKVDADTAAVWYRLQTEALAALDSAASQRNHYQAEERSRGQAWLKSHGMVNNIEAAAMAKLALSRQLRSEARNIYFSFENTWHIIALTLLLSFFVLIAVACGIVSNEMFKLAEIRSGNVPTIAKSATAQQARQSYNLPAYQPPDAPDKVLPSRRITPTRRNRNAIDAEQICADMCAEFDKLAKAGMVSPGDSGWVWDEIFSSNRRKGGSQLPTHLEMVAQVQSKDGWTEHYSRKFRDHVKVSLIQHGYFDEGHNFLAVPEKAEIELVENGDEENGRY